jgi:putative transposase
MRELAAQNPVYGHPMLYYLVKREWPTPINHKRTEKIYREEGLSLRRKRRRKKWRQLRLALPPAMDQESVWSMDFVHDRLANNQQLKFLTMVDHATRTVPDLYAAKSIKGVDVVGILERLRMQNRKPKILVVDNGPEFRSKALQEWTTANKVRLHFIEPGKPYQNGFIESFNGRFRVECLDRNVFVNVEAARIFARGWKNEYESQRPHSSLRGLTPNEFAERTMRAKHTNRTPNLELITG